MQQSYVTGRDEDPSDAICGHLIVEYVPSRQNVGTYRLQTGATAKKNLGYYCQEEFDFGPYQPLRGKIIELGRACAHRQHQNFGLIQVSEDAIRL